jgi:hypothetical protein
MRGIRESETEETEIQRLQGTVYSNVCSVGLDRHAMGYALARNLHTTCRMCVEGEGRCLNRYWGLAKAAGRELVGIPH